MISKHIRGQKDTAHVRARASKYLAIVFTTTCQYDKAQRDSVSLGFRLLAPLLLLLPFYCNFSAPEHACLFIYSWRCRSHPSFARPTGNETHT